MKANVWSGVTEQLFFAFIATLTGVARFALYVDEIASLQRIHLQPFGLEVDTGVRVFTRYVSTNSVQLQGTDAGGYLASLFDRFILLWLGKEGGEHQLATVWVTIPWANALGKALEQHVQGNVEEKFWTKMKPMEAIENAAEHGARKALEGNAEHEARKALEGSAEHGARKDDRSRSPRRVALQ
eukprot:g20891.t1